MKFKLEISCDNVTFTDCAPHDGIADILTAVADRLIQHYDEVPLDYPVLDSNGNSIGRWRLK